MTVYASADHADVFAQHKRATALPELDPLLDARIASERRTYALRSELPLSVRDCFDLIDDLQRICHDGCVLGPAEIGAIQAKLIILRINLNVFHSVNTPQLGLTATDPVVDEGVEQR